MLLSKSTLKSILEYCTGNYNKNQMFVSYPLYMVYNKVRMSCCQLLNKNSVKQPLQLYKSWIDSQCLTTKNKQQIPILTK